MLRMILLSSTMRMRRAVMFRKLPASRGSFQTLVMSLTAPAPARNATVANRP